MCACLCDACHAQPRAGALISGHVKGVLGQRGERDDRKHVFLIFKAVNGERYMLPVISQYADRF